MELFTVHRYDETVTAQNDPNREQKLLESLQKTIRKRKRKLIEEETKQKNEQEKEDNIEHENGKESEINENNEFVPDKVFDNVANEIDGPVKLATTEKSSSFTVLGEERFAKKPKIDMILPDWLAYPTVISHNLAGPSEETSIDNLNYLLPQMKASLSQMSIKHLFPVQKIVVPWIIHVHQKPPPFRPRDICVSAPTGSGKTLAYALPIVQLLMNQVDRKIRALIVLPVNELAVQVVKIFKRLCEPVGLSCVLLSKFFPFDKEQSQLIEEFNGQLYSKVDIVIATTGRLVEHLHSTKGFCLKELKFLVMDEADRIMEQIHNNWLYHLDSHVRENSDSFLSGRLMPLCYSELCEDASRQPHKLLFSATLSQDPEKLQNMRLFQPKLFTSIVTSFKEIESNTTLKTDIRGEFIGKYTTPAELTEKYCLTQPELKPLTLYTLIMENRWNRFLCFTNSGETAHRLSYVLQKLFGQDMKIEELSSGLSPNVRHSVLMKFQSGKIDGLICSDALARGIDIHGIDIVISYDAPRHVKTYIHRIGRTARAGKAGLAVTILLKNELNSFNNIIKECGKETVDELMTNTNMEEIKAKEYANAVRDMQEALKREQQNRIMRSVNEKFNSNKTTTNSATGGVISQLQSQVQTNVVVKNMFEQRDVPESWKWANQQNVKEKKERKKKKNKTKIIQKDN